MKAWMQKHKRGNAALIVIIAIVAIAVLAFGWYRSGYNRAVRLDERVGASWAQVENQLQRRNDLIPNLVNTVKGFAQQERDVFTEVTRLRSQWAESRSIAEKVETANDITQALGRLMVVAENYPQLKSNQNFLALQSQLEGTENRIAVERMRYNQSVEAFNAFRRSFFGRFFVAQVGVDEPAAYFQAVDTATEVPAVQF